MTSCKARSKKFTFPFTKTGDYPVTLSSTKSSCGCVVVGVEKKTYEPGEGGKITATFKVGDRRVKLGIFRGHGPIIEGLRAWD
jgi:hypothetical protein